MIPFVKINIYNPYTFIGIHTYIKVWRANSQWFDEEQGRVRL